MYKEALGRDCPKWTGKEKFCREIMVGIVLYTSKSRPPYLLFLMVLLSTLIVIGFFLELLLYHLSTGDLIGYIIVFVVSLFMVIVLFFDLSDQVTITKYLITVENHRYQKSIIRLYEKELIPFNSIKSAERRHSRINITLKDNKKTSIDFQIWDLSTCKKCYMVIKNIMDE